MAQTSYFLEGIHACEDYNREDFLAAVESWAGRIRKGFDIVRVVEPGLRQSILMSLLPTGAFKSGNTKPFRELILEHLGVLKIAPDEGAIRTLIDICINARKLAHLDRQSARNQSASLAELRSQPELFNRIMDRQGHRCLWCGVDLNLPSVKMSLDHITPKHLGDDPADARNWGIACTSCNRGKGSVLAWTACAEAFDLIPRPQFAEPDTLRLEHRWIVLRRDGKCVHCGGLPSVVQLNVYRHIETGFPVPFNCSSACGACCWRDKLEVLSVKWAEGEQGRKAS